MIPNAPHAPTPPTDAPSVLQDTLFPATSPAPRTSAPSNTARSAALQPLASLARTCSLPVEGLVHQHAQQISPTARSVTAQIAAPSVMWATKSQQTAHNASICAALPTVRGASQRPIVSPVRQDIP